MTDTVSHSLPFQRFISIDYAISLIFKFKKLKYKHTVVIAFCPFTLAQYHVNLALLEHPCIVIY